MAAADSDQSKDGLLQQIRQELDACKACWEEGINRLQKFEKKTDKCMNLMK